MTSENPQQHTPTEVSDDFLLRASGGQSLESALQEFNGQVDKGLERDTSLGENALDMLTFNITEIVRTNNDNKKRDQDFNNFQDAANSLSQKLANIRKIASDQNT